MSKRPRWSARRGSVIGGAALLLMIVLMGVCGLRAWIAQAGAPSGAYGAGFRIGLYAAVVFVPLIALGVAWAVGRLIRKLAGDSEQAGQIGSAVVMLAAVLLFSFGTYVSYQKRQNAPMSVQAARESPSEAAARLRAQGQATMDRMREISDRNSEAARAQAQRQMDALRPGGNTGPSPQPPTPAPPRPASGNTPRPVEPAAPTRDAVQEKIDAAMKTILTDLNQAAAAALTEVQSALEDAKKRPRVDIRELKTRVTTFETARARVSELKATLDGLEDRIRTTLRDSGVPDAQIPGATIRGTMQAKSMLRANAANDLVDLCSRAKRESELMRDNIGKFTIEKDGTIASKNFQLKSQIDSERFFLDAKLQRLDEIKDTLLGR